MDPLWLPMEWKVSDNTKRWEFQQYLIGGFNIGASFDPIIEWNVVEESRKKGI